MASYTTIEDWRDVEDGYVVDVTIRRTEAEKYPSGGDYGLHLGKSVETPSFATITPTNGRKAMSVTSGPMSRALSFRGC